MTFNDSELRFIEFHRTWPRRAIHDLFVRAFGREDVTAENIRALCVRMGWSTERARWTAEDETQLRALYADLPTAEVARRLGRTVAAVYAAADRLGLAKSAAYLASPAACRLRRGDTVGAATRFRKGGVPANKGQTMPFNAISAATQFKKGQLPHNTKCAGHERVTKDGYVQISVNEVNPHTGYERRYVLKHRWLWEQLHGPVPKGMALKSLDGNRGNTDPANWELVPKALLPRLNGIHGRGYDVAPAELKPVIMAVAKLEHVARTRRKGAASPAQRVAP